MSKKKTVGIRVPNHPVPLAMARALGRPIISTTAINEEGDPFIDPDEIDDHYHGLGLVLDADAGGLLPTTVIDLTTSPVRVVREGAGSIEEFVD